MAIKNMFLFNCIKDIDKTYKIFFESEFKKDYFILLDKKIEKEYQINKINPKYEDIFNAFKFCKLNDIKLVILGQDPYYVKNMADGLAFSTKLNICPKSLKNIFKEIEYDFNVERTNCDLTDIAKQGVLLLNTCLTVKENQAFSHKSFGWEIFSKNFIEYLSSNNKKIIYLLMGKSAWEYEKWIKNSLSIFKTSHPSPFSYHISLKKSSTFKKINDLLESNSMKKIIW